MIPDLGYYLLLMCLIINVYGCGAALVAAWLRHRQLYISAKMAQTVSCLFVCGASLILWWSFITQDYSVSYVFKNSSTDLPTHYTLTAFWSSLEGSHLLWTLFLSLSATIAIWTHARDNEHIMPYVSCVLQAVLAWMFYLLVSHSDPFVRLFPVADNGQGMNALLQNPYMAIHPPMLFIGYTLLAVPFAYAVAALCYGDITEGWLKSVRRWTLLAFCFLTAGVSLGGRWAYVELGWAGYWAWDPVENSSFLPWLFCVCLIHSLLVQEKLGHLKRLTIVLAFFAFFFSFFGTFITRSGVVSSVHSFAQSPIGPNYLMFLAVLILAFIALYAFRAVTILPADNEKVWGVAKESALLITQFILLTLAIIVIIGTMFPIVSEAISGQRISVQAPYFNSFAPYIGLALIVAIALGNIMRYQRTGITGGFKTIWLSALFALPWTILFCWKGEVLATRQTFALIAQLIGIYLCFTCFAVITIDVGYRLASLRFKATVFLQRNLAYLGAFIAHVGILVAILGFLGNYRALEKQVNLNHGQTTDFFGYQFRFDGIDSIRVDNAVIQRGNLNVSRGTSQSFLLHPGRSKYPTSTEIFNEIAVAGNFWHDVYVVLADYHTEQQSATFSIHINPTVRIVWISIFLMVIGGLIALADRYRGNRSRDFLGAG